MPSVKFSCVDISSMICASGSRERDVKRRIIARVIILNLDSRILIFEETKKKILVCLQITFLLVHFHKCLVFFIS
jgi:hypothetical protein